MAEVETQQVLATPTLKKRGRPPTYKTAEEKRRALRENDRRYSVTQKGKEASQRAHAKQREKIKAGIKYQKQMETIKSLEIALLEARLDEISKEELILALKKFSGQK